ncbi:hypothetical protein CHLRE_03g166201v5 [Chlamydomonas reinhardtii]|uniref:Uncharacterized protein n=1 Tax=Chlamydomonas reinhardtii TaxID=3055 RepID=A8IFC2_CHLRE|nr:uncharacterized protein CHLRE_03g166201v5 [Chlamydomonas reinhardtii]PNW84970.1 hypothetical protein CHLRE_03g166201v5 [Chlamydomonas reinhardtii]|eukprot:XP_001703356.1 Sec14p-like lipid-binding protein [Chlamydomonas reinhardtii]
MVTDLPPELVERAAQELNETPESRATGLKALHDHYNTHPDQRPHRTDDAYLLMFLRWAKFDAAKAMGRLAALERWMHDCRDALGDVAELRGEAFSDIMAKGFMCNMLSPEHRTRDGAAVTLLRPRCLLPINDPAVILRLHMWHLMRAVHDPHIQVCGRVVAPSFKGLTLAQGLQIRREVPAWVLKQHFRFLQECMPFRLRGVWLVYQPAWFSLLFTFVRPFLGPKTRSRIRLLGDNAASMAELMDPAYMPAGDMPGGTGADCGREWFARELAREAAERGKAGEGQEGKEGEEGKEEVGEEEGEGHAEGKGKEDG